MKIIDYPDNLANLFITLEKIFHSDLNLLSAFSNFYPMPSIIMYNERKNMIDYLFKISPIYIEYIRYRILYSAFPIADLNESVYKPSRFSSCLCLVH